MDELDNKDPGEVFGIPDLYCPSKLLIDTSQNPSFLFSALKLDGLQLLGKIWQALTTVDTNERPPAAAGQTQPEDGFFSIPDLSFGPAEDIPTPTQSISSHNELVNRQQNEVNVDREVWVLPDEIPLATTNYQSWDAFENERFKELHTPYITEAGPSSFDTAFAAKENFLRIGGADNIVVEAKAYSSSVLALGLGRSSVFFTWDEEKQSFVPAVTKLRISGYSGDSLNGLLRTFFDCGNITRILQAFVEKTYSGNTSPGRIALADAVSTLLATIQSRLSVSASTHQSILQLQSLFHPAHSILTCFQRIVVNVSATRSDESMLSTIFEEIQLLEHRTDSLRDVLLEILSRVSRPWLEFTGEWLGLQREAGLPLTKEGSGKSFVKVENKEWIDDQGLELQEPDYFLDYDKVPAFIQPEDARAMFEVGRSLRFLRAHHANHPLARANLVASTNPPTLLWKFSWQDIVQVEAKALQYEKDLTKALLQFSKGSLATPTIVRNKLERDNSTLNYFGKPEEDMQAHVLASINTFNRPFNESTSHDQLSFGLNTYLTSKELHSGDDESIFAPPISLVPILSFNPIIGAQARIVNGTCMRMFFNSHKLREHLSVQRSFQLMGNGVFSSRLSHALFDPELESAERHRGVTRSGGIMGLRLGGRDNWPPASSELRLALMGVLTDSYTSTEPLNKSHVGTYLDNTSLPGDLSFAVRDMSQEEIEKCLDPDSVEALDFLRLSYKPPPPLEAVITPMILFKYDQVFKLLLRVIRMLYVVSALFRDATNRSSLWQDNLIAQRFRIEAHHFVASVCGYFFDTGIEATWRIFERKLDQVERRISMEGENVTLGQNEGLDKLRDYHERVLDRIMFALLLRKRQQPVLKLLEEIFALILQFLKHSRHMRTDIQSKSAASDEVKEIYGKFQKKVRVFITVCRGLSEKKGYGEKRTLHSKTSGHEGLFDGDLAEENTIAHLLLRLEMSNYYSRI